MNTRRNFLQQMILSGAGAMILPAATTYERIWRPKSILPVRWIVEWQPITVDPDLLNQLKLIDAKYRCVMSHPFNINDYAVDPTLPVQYKIYKI